MIKKNEMLSCGAPVCTNPAEKNSNIITLIPIIIMLLKLYWHIQKPDIFNGWGIIRTLPNIQDDEAY